MAFSPERQIRVGPGARSARANEGAVTWALRAAAEGRRTGDLARDPTAAAEPPATARAGARGPGRHRPGFCPNTGRGAGMADQVVT